MSINWKKQWQQILIYEFMNKGRPALPARTAPRSAGGCSLWGQRPRARSFRLAAHSHCCSPGACRAPAPRCSDRRVWLGERVQSVAVSTRIAFPPTRWMEKAALLRGSEAACGDCTGRLAPQALSQTPRSSGLFQGNSFITRVTDKSAHHIP